MKTLIDPPEASWLAARELDLRGLKCPLPAMKTAKALTRMAKGELVVVFATDPLSAIDIPHAAVEAGGRVVTQTRLAGELVFRIER